MCIRDRDKYQVITNTFWSNWFFSIGGGASVMYGDNDQQLGDFGKRISPTMNISDVYKRQRHGYNAEKLPIQSEEEGSFTIA